METFIKTAVFIAGLWVVAKLGGIQINTEINNSENDESTVGKMAKIAEEERVRTLARESKKLANEMNSLEEKENFRKEVEDIFKRLKNNPDGCTTAYLTRNDLSSVVHKYFGKNDIGFDIEVDESGVVDITPKYKGETITTDTFDLYESLNRAILYDTHDVTKICNLEVKVEVE